MLSIHAVHLAALDLNLLVALDALLVERHVTRAAKRVGLSQPAMSHALARLRDLLADPLFVRTPAGMQPTARALAIEPTLARCLADLQQALAEPPRFDPKTARRTFSIATSDYLELVLLPGLIERLAQAAPHVNLVVRGGPMGLERLAQGTLDLVIRPAASPGPGYHTENVLHERFVCVMRKGHPLARGRLTLDRYCAANHALVSPGGALGGIVDDALAALGRTRRVALVLQHFLVAPHVVAASDHVVTLGARMARVFQKLLPLAVVPPPLPLPELTMAMHWHETQVHDPALVWLRDEVRATLRATRARGRTP